MSEQRYLVSARKYRPQTFGEIVGQEHVSETLVNAISSDRLAHAYLFSGPRGVGKTTAARILAKAINCQTPLSERPKKAEPCNKCESCSTFVEGRNLNVIEIDAASNNSVQDIRDLRDTVRIPPQGAAKKVYIVDEVHMLSRSAFNAFLKTLEEPPPYALFIFATTDPHKVLPTILSRCQRFDFRRIATSEIVNHLKFVCERESVTADDDALLLIATKGDGALRDALSVFDQAVAMCGTNIAYADLAKALRVVDAELFFETSRCIRTGDAAAGMQVVDRLVSAGFDLKEFLNGLAMHFRNLLVAATMSDTRLLEVSDSNKKQYKKEATAFSQTELLRLLMICSKTLTELRGNTQPRLTVELGLLKMINVPNMVDLSQAIDRLGQLEKNESAREHLPPKKKSGPSVSPKAGEADESESSISAELATPAPSQNTEKTAVPAETAPGPAEAQAAPSDIPNLFGAPALKRKRPTAETSLQTEGSAALAVDVQPERESPADDVERVWLKFVGSIKELRIHVGSLLQHAAPLGLTNGVLSTAVPDEFHKRLLTNQQEFLTKHLCGMTTASIKKMRFSVRPDLDNRENVQPEFDPVEYMNQKRQENPVIKAIFDEFGGELVW